MPKADPLNPKRIDALKPTGDYYDVFDGLVPGLAVRVGPTGTKSFRLYYRSRGKLRRLTLGAYSSAFGLAKARKLAEQHRGKIHDGADPVRDRDADRETWGDTVAALIDRYLEQPSVKKMRQLTEKTRILNVYIRPAWKDTRVAELTRRDIKALIDDKAQDAPGMARNILKHLSALLTFAVDEELLQANPAARIEAPAGGTRERILNREEIRALWQTLDEPDASAYVAAKVVVPSHAHRAAFLVLLLTGQRLTETCAMRWKDVDTETGWWTLPGSVTKNEQAHRVYLTPTVREILGKRADAGDADDTYVFSSRIKGTSIAARAKKTASTLSAALGFSFTAHDLRRTVASGMAASGIPRFDIAAVLNHRSVTKHGVTALYDLYAYDREKRVALERWSRVVNDIIEGKATTRVVSIRRGKS